MTADRLQSAWGYVAAEIWRPLVKRFEAEHPDLPIEIVRTMLVRPRGMTSIFVDQGRFGALDTLRADAARYLDSVGDAKTPLRRIKPQFFLGGRTIAALLKSKAIRRANKARRSD